MWLRRLPGTRDPGGIGYGAGGAKSGREVRDDDAVVGSEKWLAPYSLMVEAK